MKLNDEPTSKKAKRSLSINVQLEERTVALANVNKTSSSSFSLLSCILSFSNVLDTMKACPLLIFADGLLYGIRFFDDSLWTGELGLSRLSGSGDANRTLFFSPFSRLFFLLLVTFWQKIAL
jgi:hypothetical protein